MIHAKLSKADHGDVQNTEMCRTVHTFQSSHTGGAGCSRPHSLHFLPTWRNFSLISHLKASAIMAEWLSSLPRSIRLFYQYVLTILQVHALSCTKNKNWKKKKRKKEICYFCIKRFDTKSKFETELICFQSLHRYRAKYLEYFLQDAVLFLLNGNSLI